MEKVSGKYRYTWALLKELVKTEFKLRYKGSVLGMLWSALKPFLLFLIMYTVFVKFLHLDDGVPHFAVALLFGTVLWTFFSESTNQGMRSIVDRGDVLRKINIPKYIIPVSTTASALVNLSINLVIVFVFAIINGVEFSWTVLLFIPLLFELCLLSVGASLLLSALYVRFRDVSHIWEVFMQGAFYATPIFWPLARISEANPTAAKLLLMGNPMAQIIQDARWAVVGHNFETIWSLLANNPVLALVPFLVVVGIFAVGVLYFRKRSKFFTEVM